MRRAPALVMVGLVSLVTMLCARAPAADPDRLFREGRWFDLRDAVTDQSRALLRGAVAAAFNDTAVAEDLLWNVVRSEPAEADDAYELLCRIYRRSGQYARLAETYRAWSSAFPDSAGVARWGEDRDKFGRPDQINPVTSPFTLRPVRDGYLTLPVSINGQRVLTTLDTGANSTELNANFAALFPQLVESEGKGGTSELTGVGGSQTFESIELPELVFTIGATDVALRPATITLQRLALLGGECCIGNAGHDLLIQGRGFGIEFSRMTLSVY